MADSEDPSKPAGPNRAQSFNGFHMLGASVLMIIASAVLLANAKNDNRDVVFATIGIGVGIIGVIIAVWMLRRYWWKRGNGLTLDEAEPHRTPEQQLRRDDRVRRQNADMTPRQEIAVGAILLPGAFVFPAINVLFGRALGYGDLIVTGGLIILGGVLLVRGLVRRRKRP
jgi:hypothetical protein